MTTGQRQLKTQLRNAYLRGFRAAVAGDRTLDVLDGLRRHPESAFARGYEAGKAATVMAEHQADRYADTVLASPAVAQARRNAGEVPA